MSTHHVGIYGVRAVDGNVQLRGFVECTERNVEALGLFFGAH